MSQSGRPSQRCACASSPSRPDSPRNLAARTLWGCLHEVISFSRPVDALGLSQLGERACTPCNRWMHTDHNFWGRSPYPWALSSDCSTPTDEKPADPLPDTGSRKRRRRVGRGCDQRRREAKNRVFKQEQAVRLPAPSIAMES